MLNFTEKDNGSQVDVDVNTRFRITLGENPTTGFRWTINLSGDNIRLDDSSFIADAPDVGSGGQRSLTLVCTGIGASAIDCKLWRDWEGEDSVARRFRLTVKAS